MLRPIWVPLKAELAATPASCRLLPGPQEAAWLVVLLMLSLPTPFSNLLQELKEAARNTDGGIQLLPDETNLLSWRALLQVGSLLGRLCVALPRADHGQRIEASTCCPGARCSRWSLLRACKDSIPPRVIHLADPVWLRLGCKHPGGAASCPPVPCHQSVPCLSSLRCRGHPTAPMRAASLSL